MGKNHYLTFPLWTQPSSDVCIIKVVSQDSVWGLRYKKKINLKKPKLKIGHTFSLTITQCFCYLLMLKWLGSSDLFIFRLVAEISPMTRWLHE